MRILFIFTGFLRTQGGGERVLNTLSNYLMSNGNEVRFLVAPMVNADKECTRDKSEWVEPFKSNKDKTYIVKIGNFLGIPKTKEYKLFADFFSKKFLPEIIIVTSPFFAPVVKKALKLSKIDSKVIGWYHGSLFPKRKIRFVPKYIAMKNTLKYADAHLAISTGIRNQILRLDSKAKVYTVFNPVESYKGSLITRSTTAIFLYVGRLYDPQKNISFMLKGFSKIKKDWKLIIVGTGQDESKLKSLARSLRISDKIEWRGFKKDPYENLDDGITALLLTSRYEGFGMVLVEANQRGIPVISSDCKTGPSDIVIPGKNGYLYPEGDMAKFVEIVKDVIDGKLGFDTPENIAKTAERFSEEKVGGGILDVLLKINSKG